MERARDILVVDDSASNRALLALLLQEQGYVVSCAANGQEALDYLLRYGRPRCILLDLSMAGMDGWEFRRLQKQIPYLASIPVFLVSAERDLQRIADSLGVNGYFPKPIEIDALLEAIRGLVEERSTSRLHSTVSVPLPLGSDSVGRH